MAVINLTKLLKGKTGWVSISSNNKKVVAQGKTLKELLIKLKKLGNPDGSIMISTKDFSRYVG